MQDECTNFYIQVYYINFYAIKFLLYKKCGMLHIQYHSNYLYFLFYPCETNIK